MADTTHHDSPEAIHYHVPEDRIKRRTMSFGAAFILFALVVAIGVLVSKLNKQTTALAGVQTQLEKANAETASAKADLAKANGKASDLLSQLDNSNSAQVDFQAQIKKAQESDSALQAQLDQARTGFQSEQEKTKTQAAELQSQLRQANTTVTGLRSEFDAAKKENADLKTQLDQAKAVATQPPPAATTPIRALPLTTEFKKSFFGGKITLQMKNTGADALKLDLRILGSDKTPSQSTTISPGETFKLEGVTAGATIIVESDGFTPITLTAQ